jgi:hypothetical protein
MVQLADGTTNVYRANRPTNTTYTRARQAAVNALGSQGMSTLTPNVNQYLAGTFRAQNRAPAAPAVNRNLGGAPRTGGSRGGGGGGGGAPSMSQEQLDWIASMLGAGGPRQWTPATLDLPDYNATFDPTVYNELEAKLGTAVGQSRAAAGEAYGNLENYLNTNYRNAFAQGAPQGQAPGMDQASMARMLQSQGVGPEAVAGNAQGAAAGNAAFGNLWALLGANEDTAQRNRLNRVQTDRGTTSRALDAALLQGQTGIGLQRGQAQTAFNERAEQARNQIAQQEAMANWTAQNQAGQSYNQAGNEYRNAQLQALMGLLPQLIGTNLNLPTPQQIGM